VNGLRRFEESMITGMCDLKTLFLFQNLLEEFDFGMLRNFGITTLFLGDNEVLMERFELEALRDLGKITITLSATEKNPSLNKKTVDEFIEANSLDVSICIC
jgi:hypothetical protein